VATARWATPSERTGPYPLVKANGLRKHVEDYAAYRCTPQEYTDRLYVAHYGPQGNHFFAFAVKDDVVAWLDPKPPAYDREAGDPLRHLAATFA
jgi:hypothetical protein